MNQLAPLLEKELTRKEFLTVAGLGVASIFGLSTIIKLLTGKSSSRHLNGYTGSFGASNYGGKTSSKTVKL